MIVRRELPGDAPAVEVVTSAAFAVEGSGEEPVETQLLRALRADAGWIPELSLVAVIDDAIVGHVVATRGHAGATPAVGLGPISVLPAVQGRGVGTALMHAIVGAADALGEPLVALLGDTSFYSRFGFGPAAELGIAAPDPAWGEHFQARRLTRCPPGIGGEFRYAAPFGEL